MGFGISWQSIRDWPATKSKIVYAVQVASWDNWRETGSWLGYNVLGSFMPLWGSYFLLRSAGQVFAVREFMQHGEFAIYSAAFLAPALQLIVRNLSDKRYVLRTGSVLLAVFGLMICAFLYAGVPRVSNTSVPAQGPQPQPGFFFVSSWCIFVATLIFVSLVTLIQLQRENPNVAEIEKSQQNDLKKRFEEKVGSGDVGR